MDASPATSRAARGSWFLHLASKTKTLLESQARDFAKGLSRLLNRTVCRGIHLNGVTITEKRVALVGRSISAQEPLGQPIPLTRSKAPAHVFLDLRYMLRLDHEDRLNTVESQIQLQVSGKGNRQRKVRGVLAFDYTQQPENAYPPAHLHFDGQSSMLEDLLEGVGVTDKKPSDLHIPVGSPRFRPCLEDVIEFCIIEGLANPADDWETVLKQSRDAYYEKQLRSAILDRPEVAAEVLRGLDYSVTSPTE